jgi:hypothetical protein
MKLKKIDETLFGKLKKITQMAELGMPGERDNAARILKGILKKYGLSKEDIIDNDRKLYSFSTRNKRERLILANIVCMVLNKTEVIEHKVNGARARCGYELNKLEHTEVLELFNLYIRSFRNQIKQMLDDYTDAFIHRNELFSQQTMRSGTVDKKNNDDSDPDKIKRILSMMLTMKRVRRPLKQIENRY